MWPAMSAKPRWWDWCRRALCRWHILPWAAMPCNIAGNADVSLPYPGRSQNLRCGRNLHEAQGSPRSGQRHGNLWAEGSECQARSDRQGPRRKGNTRPRFRPASPNLATNCSCRVISPMPELSRNLEPLRRLGLPFLATKASACRWWKLRPSAAPSLPAILKFSAKPPAATRSFSKMAMLEKSPKACANGWPSPASSSSSSSPEKSLVTWRQSAEMLKAIMFNGAASFSVEVGIKATVNLAVPGRTAGNV